MAGEFQPRFTPRRQISTDALNHMAQQAEVGAEMSTPGLYRDGGGLSLLLDPGLFLAEITDFIGNPVDADDASTSPTVDGGTGGNGNTYWYAWRAVRFSETGQLLDYDPPATGTCSAVDFTNRAVHPGLFSPDRCLIGDLVILKQGMGGTYEVWARAGSRDVLFFKVTSSVTAGSLTCTGVPVVRSWDSGGGQYVWSTAPFSTVADTWRLQAQAGSPSPVQNNIYLGRLVAAYQPGGSSIEYVYGIEVPGVSVQFDSFESSVPHASVSPTTVSRLRFGPDFDYDTSAVASGGTVKIDPYVAGRYQPGIVAANYLSASTRFSSGYQWLGDDVKCFGNVFARDTIYVGTTDLAGGTSTDYAPPQISGHGSPILSLGIYGSNIGFVGGLDGLRVSGHGHGFSISYSGIIGTITIDGNTNLRQVASTSPISAVFDNSFFYVGGDASLIWPGGVPGSWVLASNKGWSDIDNFVSRGTVKNFLCGRTVVGAESDTYVAQLLIGQKATGFAAQDWPGVLYITEEGTLECDVDNGRIKPSPSTVGITDSFLGIVFTNGWCTDIPDPAPTGFLVGGSGGSLSGSAIVRDEGGTFQVKLDTDRWLEFGLASF